MKAEDWKQIEKDFIKWDIEGKFCASQRQILDWFSERLLESPEQPQTAEEISKEWMRDKLTLK